MPPRNFADDGAVGAISGAGAEPATGSQTGGFTVSDPGPGSGGQIGGVTVTDPGPGGSAPPSSDSGLPGAYGGGGPKVGPALQTSPLADGSPATAANVAAQSSKFSDPGGFGGNAAGLAFADGGAVSDDDTNGSPQQDAISKALESVDQILSFGRKLHGFGDNEGAVKSAGAMPMIPGNQSETPGPYVPQQPKPQQMAANMPAVPGSQSESGRPPVQPMPGPLPPTSNPFGKRADAESDEDNPAINTDEDTA